MLPGDQVYAIFDINNIYLSIERDRDMRRNSKTESREVIKILRKRKIVTIEELAELINRSIHTARRRLKSWKVYTSYNKNGRYYALPDVPEFDSNGLWHWHGVFFSKYGNLKQTVVELVRHSPAGHDAGEMHSLLGLDPRSFLSAFSDHPQLKREKAQGRFVYYSVEASVQTRQKKRRSVLDAKGRQPTSAEAIAVLIEKIKRPELDNKALSRKLRKQKVFVEPDAIDAFFASHGLEVKKKPRSN